VHNENFYCNRKGNQKVCKSVLRSCKLCLLILDFWSLFYPADVTIKDNINTIVSRFLMISYYLRSNFAVFTFNLVQFHLQFGYQMIAKTIKKNILRPYFYSANWGRCKKRFQIIVPQSIKSSAVLINTFSLQKGFLFYIYAT
jgi:hypothetical protein